MGEVRQTNFRVDQDTADKFREFCAAAGMNQAQGFDHVNANEVLVKEQLSDRAYILDI